MFRVAFKNTDNKFYFKEGHKCEQFDKIKLIRLEISACSFKKIREFIIIFPCEKKIYKIECDIHDKDDGWNYCNFEFFFESPEKFWKDWNKFKKLKIFL